MSRDRMNEGSDRKGGRTVVAPGEFGFAASHFDHARVENFAHPETPELEDFGEATLTLDNGAAAYCRVDWLNPGGSKVWGDGRTFVLGTRELAFRAQQWADEHRQSPPS